MKVLTPEQLEDAAITDAINTVVGFDLRARKREMTNDLRGQLIPQVQKARLEGRRIDIPTLVQRMWKDNYAGPTNK